MRFLPSSFRSSTALVTPFLLVASLLLITACDSGGALNDGTDESTETTTITGTVEDDNTQKSLTAKDAVGGATVSAVRLNDDGSTVEFESTAETDSDGSFELTIERQTKGATIVVNAEKSGSDFSSSVGVQITDNATTKAQPMTPETNAEAEVATEINKQAGDAERAAEALADAAALVDNEVANAILSGDTAPSDIATLARSMDETREEYANNAEASIDQAAVADAEQDAYEQLQQALATASDSASRAQALATFDDAMASSYEEAGASPDLQAEIEQAGTQVALEAVDAGALPDEASSGLERRATVLRSIATSASIDAFINGTSVGSDVSTGLDNARETLLTDVRSASSVSEIQNATANYRKSVKDEMETAFNMSSTDVQDGFDNLQSALDNLNGALDTAISTTNGVDVNADAVSNAFQKFYDNGVATVQDVYDGQGMQQGPAEAAAEVTAKAGVF